MVTFVLFSFDALYSRVKVDAIKINPPSNVELTKLATSGHITVTWEAVKDAEFYTLYRSSSKDGNFTLHTENIRENSFVDKNVDVGKLYYYKVMASAGSCKSGFSPVSVAFIPVEIPKLIASNGSYKNGIKLQCQFLR